MFASIFNTYITDTENEFRKNHIALKRNFYNSEVLAERTAAPTQGVRAGQNSLPRKVTPKGSTSTQFPRCPLSILPATHKRTADPPVVFLSDSDTPDVARQTPRNKSTPRRAARVSSAPRQSPAAQDVVQTPSNPLYSSLSKTTPSVGFLDPNHQSLQPETITASEVVFL